MLFPDAVQRAALAERCAADPGSFHIMSSPTPDRPDSEPGTIPGLQRNTPQGLRAALRPGKVRRRYALGIAESATGSSNAIALLLRGRGTPHLTPLRWRATSRHGQALPPVARDRADVRAGGRMYSEGPARRGR